MEQNIAFPVLLDYKKPDEAYLEEILTVLSLQDRRIICLASSPEDSSSVWQSVVRSSPTPC